MLYVLKKTKGATGGMTALIVVIRQPADLWTAPKQLSGCGGKLPTSTPCALCVLSGLFLTCDLGLPGTYNAFSHITNSLLITHNSFHLLQSYYL